MGAREGRRTGQALEEDAAQGEDVGPGVEGPIGDGLLGGHVPDRAEHDPRVRHRPLDWPSGRELEPHDSKVEEFGPRGHASDEKHVARLHVAVHDAPGVRRGEPFGDAERDRNALGGRERRAVEPLREVLAFQPLHRQKRLARGGDPVGHVADDGRVRQLGEDARFLSEPLVVLPSVRHDLERHGRARHPIEGAVHRPHSSAPGEALDDEAIDEDVALHQARRSGTFARHGVARRGQLAERRVRRVADAGALHRIADVRAFRCLGKRGLGQHRPAARISDAQRHARLTASPMHK